MRVLLITQWFDPEPAPKGLAFAQAIAAAGHEVEVVTGFPNYPGGRLYPGYRLKLLQRESADGVTVNRVPLYPSHDSGAIGRSLNYLSFFLSSFLFGLFVAKRPDVIYCYHPPLTSGLAAGLVARLRRVPLVYDIQDLWPDTLRATGMIGSERVLRLIDRLCSWVYRRADAISVLSPGFKKKLLDRGVAEGKVSVIFNWCDETQILAPVSGQVPAQMDGKFNIVFAGTMGKAQALDSVIHAAARVARSDSRVQFVFVGGGVEVDRLKRMAKEVGAENVVFVPAMPMKAIGVVLERADVLLVHLKDDPLFAITIPSKTQAYMACGRPVLMAVRGDAADLVTSADAGIVATPENVESIVTAVLQLSAMPAEQLKQMGENGRRFYHEHLSMERGVAKFVNLFSSVGQSST